MLPKVSSAIPTRIPIRFLVKGQGKDQQAQKLMNGVLPKMRKLTTYVMNYMNMYMSIYVSLLYFKFDFKFQIFNVIKHYTCRGTAAGKCKGLVNYVESTTTAQVTENCKVIQFCRVYLHLLYGQLREQARLVSVHKHAKKNLANIQPS